jgi:hypothetical protein
MSEKPTGQQAKNCVRNRGGTTSNEESGGANRLGYTSLKLGKTLLASGVHGGSLRYAVSRRREVGMMDTSDANGRLCRVGLHVEHGLRYTYIAWMIPV